MFDKITKFNFKPSKDNGRFLVYSKQFNELVDDIKAIFTSDTTLEIATVTATTVNATTANLDSVVTDSVEIATEPGTPNTGVTAVTYGDGKNFTTVLTVDVENAVTVADNAALADGYLLYTFPAGEVVVTASSMSMGLTLAEDTTATPDVGLGTLLASDAQATLSADDAACENILTGQTAADAAGTETLKTVGNQVLVIGTADDHTVYFNIAATWADTAGADLTGDIAGTVVLKWSIME